MNPPHVALIDCLEVALAPRNGVASGDSLGMLRWKHCFRIRSEVNSLGHLSESDILTASSLFKLRHRVLVFLRKDGSGLKVSGTHLLSEFLGIVGSAWSLTGAIRNEAVLGLLHRDGLHIVLVADGTSIEVDASLRKFVLESVSILIQAVYLCLLGESRFCL